MVGQAIDGLQPADGKPGAAIEIGQKLKHYAVASGAAQPK